jgi:PAS domain S-box-containing protein
MDNPELSIRELDALFDQSPVAMLFSDCDLRTRRANAAFRQLTGIPDEALIGRRPSETMRADRMVDTHLIEGILADQVIKEGTPVVNMSLEAPRREGLRVFAWTAYRVTDNGQVLGAVSTLLDVTGPVESARALRHANGRLDLLQRAGSEIGTTLDIHRTAQELARLAVPELADRITVDLADPVLREEELTDASQDELRFYRVAARDTTTTAPINFDVGEAHTIPVTSAPAVAFLHGDSLLAGNQTEMRQAGLDPRIVQGLLNRGVHSFLSVPLTARGVTLGLAVLSRAENAEPYDDADIRLISDLVARAAVHVDNARLYTGEHDAAVTLQRSLLPRYIPQVPGLDIAYRYQPASQAAEIGGDWFDVIPLDGGPVALVVGDVTGHGIRAAAIMGQLRTTATALAHMGCPPDEIIRQLNAVVAAHGDEAGATCLHAQYDPRSRRCRLANAGHPPPLLRRPGGRTDFIDLPDGLLLGAGEGDYALADIELPLGGVLAMYTDGLIERPGEDLGIGMSRLARALAEGPAQSLDDLCDSVLASLSPQPRDDVALLIARTTAV